MERQVFEAVVHLRSATVAEVSRNLTADGRALAYTTVMTVLSRLFEKGYLIRQREGKAYRYSAREAASIAGSLVSKAAQDAFGRFGGLALSGFVETLTPEQRAVLVQLLQDADDTVEGTQS